MPSVNVHGADLVVTFEKSGLYFLEALSHCAQWISFFFVFWLYFKCSSARLAVSQLPQIKTLVTRQDTEDRRRGAPQQWTDTPCDIKLLLAELAQYGNQRAKAFKPALSLYHAGLHCAGMCVSWYGSMSQVRLFSEETKSMEASAGKASALLTGGEQLFVWILALCGNGS